jgi:hypothetical protein
MERMSAKQVMGNMSMKELNRQIDVDARTTDSECRTLAQEITASIRAEWGIQVYGMSDLILELRDWHR